MSIRLLILITNLGQNEKQEGWPFFHFADLLLFIFPLCAPFILCNPMPALPAVGNKGEEIRVCPALKALCSDFLQGSSLLGPFLKLCSVSKTLQDFQAQPTQISGFQREALTGHLLIFSELRWRSEYLW